MRQIIIILTLALVVPSSVFCATDATFDAFIKSREVVATLYFPPNSDNLTTDEIKRLANTVSELRKLQKNGRMIRVEGYSSPEGNQEDNFQLSFFRAKSVVDLIEAEGLPAEVTLTGYGDLHAKLEDPSKERRVEIASYIKPVGMKKVKVAEEDKKRQKFLNQGPTLSRQSTESEVDSYSVDQAIRSKIEDKGKGLADQGGLEESNSPGVTRSVNDGKKNMRIDSYRIDQAIRRKIDKDKDLADQIELEDKETPGLSQSEKNMHYDLERGYTQWRKSVDPDYAQKLSQLQKESDIQPLQRFSQLTRPVDPSDSPGVTQVMPAHSPEIDALMIEQAIMEKIGAATAAPSGAVSQVSMDYQSAGSSN